MIEKSFAQKLAHRAFGPRLERVEQHASSFPQPLSVLLVQHHGPAARALTRLLNRYYAEVRLVTDPEQAEQMLTDGGWVPDLVVCGQMFGRQSPLGHELLRAWRRRHPQIRRAILATGVDQVPRHLEGVDGIYEKPAPLSQLLSLLEIHAPSPAVA